MILIDVAEAKSTESRAEVTFRNVTEQLCTLYLEKNERYGDSFHKQFIEYGLLCPVIRLSDKLERVKTLLKKGYDCGDETIEDTLKDLANYAIMTLMEFDRRCLNEKQQS